MHGVRVVWPEFCVIGVRRGIRAGRGECRRSLGFSGSAEQSDML